jgi:hypothetical protein
MNTVLNYRLNENLQEVGAIFLDELWLLIEQMNMQHQLVLHMSQQLLYQLETMLLEVRELLNALVMLVQQEHAFLILWKAHKEQTGEPFQHLLQTSKRVQSQDELEQLQCLQLM